ncbi:MAG: xanthine dehydrogenase family protein molybdopterin-binding subunit [Aigarchaeota archaeon]|nr:xanthine dehydrogenase family protein molybdopterin-binding subunit [Candidatus Pelearchaeum maunauluense]
MCANLLGKPVRRLEDRRLLVGEARFIEDINIPRALHCIFLRSPVPHARIRRINAEKALRNPRIHAVIDGEMVASRARPLYTLIDKTRYYGIAVGKARYVGEPLAMILAETREDALDAAEEIEIDYEPLPPLTDPEEALRNNEVLLHEELGSNIAVSKKLTYGDVDDAFAEADETIHSKLYFDRYAAAPIECCGVLVDYSPNDDSLTIYDNQQTPLLFHGIIADALGVASNKLRFIEPEIGGGFGVKIMLYPYVFLLAFAARELRRPVRWIETRREHLAAMAHSSNRVFDAEMALRRDGEILALRTKMIEDCGAYVRLPDPGGIIRSLMTYLGCYRVRNVEVEAHVVMTNKCPTGPVRGYGCQQAYFMLERMMDIAARKLGIPPTEIRLRNFIKKEEQPYTTPFGCIYDGGDYAATLKRALELAETEKLKQENKDKLIGVGIATIVEPAVTNLARNKLLNPALKTSGSGEGAIVKMDDNGYVYAFIASIPQGQGHETVAAQLVAEMLGVEPSSVRVVKGDSSAVYHSPYSGTWGSRFSVMTLGALKIACERLREKILAIAAALLEASPTDLELHDGRVHVKGSEISITLREIAQTAYRDTLKLRGRVEEGGLQAQAFYDYPTFTEPDEEGRLNMSATYGNSAHVAVVEVDQETFKVNVLRYVAVHDCGRVLNPLIVDGQIAGGVAQGLGATLYETIRYDEDGQLLTSTLADYLIPTALDTPTIIIDHLETPSPYAPLQAKGMGEGPLIPVAAAIANAVEDALHQKYNITITHSSITPDYLWKLVKTRK